VSKAETEGLTEKVGLSGEGALPTNHGPGG